MNTKKDRQVKSIPILFECFQKRGYAKCLLNIFKFLNLKENISKI